MATLFVVNRVLAILRVHSGRVRRVLEFGPTVVGRDGAWLDDALDREGLDQVDVDEALREHGLDDVSEMKLATLEGDGSISIVAVEGKNGIASRRRRRYRRPR